MTPMFSQSFLTALATPAGPSLKAASRNVRVAGASAWPAALVSRCDKVGSKQEKPACPGAIATAPASARISCAVDLPSSLLRDAMLRAWPRISAARASNRLWRSSTVAPSI